MLKVFDTFSEIHDHCISIKTVCPNTSRNIPTDSPPVRNLKASTGHLQASAGHLQTSTRHLKASTGSYFYEKPFISLFLNKKSINFSNKSQRKSSNCVLLSDVSEETKILS